ncbi:ATP-binding cassette domain-containing protein [Verminephrobacter eiseniae]|uniref:ATP-binding cassette domain-containing protein n=2 Tax=Verminephrobacter eiseniae TaxID=364317 RepID=UPI0010DBE932|nr:ABC transporter ATP-binding protein [Verminephrobacter eiseniae]KAB7598134.1 ABC transporter ATP-binding protein [Verminephrobacter sp. Larva24]MCW5230845.1 ABC transporter ATP-binding protein [Verminephrobacter eiseniae]MCW5292578.1 ABC transporter ATP-binding protein [Verminephrobacter eiseniae]MCW8185882.1 ABC transporter ATP-binding protein [Verminephrobacter eiseniae]MCW8224516.1 ABC transporter ATP-binding protein [Verminephrobacter eiseniae]
MKTAETCDGAMSPPITPATPMLLQLADLVFERTDGFTLCVPELHLACDEVLGVIGPNGSGKTSLLSCLLGTAQAGHGRVTLLGDPAGRLALATRQHFGLQMQGAGYNELYLVRDIQRLHGLIYGRSDAAVFDAFGVPALGAKRFGRLSSGEQQRVQLAMALAHHPRLAVFDEPTSNLDPAYEETFCGIVRTRRAAGDFGALVITHSPRVVTLCDRLMILDAGKVDALGAPSELVKARFDLVGCRIVAPAPARAEALAALRDTARRVIENDRSLVLYGGADLRQAAFVHLQSHGVDSCTLWTPDATDLLEGIRHG